jgi:CBS domain-containing protein
MRPGGGWQKLSREAALLPVEIEEARTMTATAPGATSLERLLGTVGEAMTNQVVALAAETPADVALRRLERARVSGAPVLDRDRVVGVVTVGDLLGPALTEDAGAQTTGPFHRHEHHLTRWRVGELMTAEPVTARADWPLAQAVEAMDRAGINRLPVIDPNGRPTGILTRDDVLHALARRIRQLRPPTRGSQMEPD